MRGGLVRRMSVTASDTAAKAAPGATANVWPGATGESWKPDFLVWSVGLALLSYVWRVHEVFPVLGSLKFALLVTAAALLFLIVDKDPRRKLESLRHPISTTIFAIIILITLSIPTSVNRIYSFNSFTQDYLRNVLLMAILVVSVRGFQDLKNYVLAFVVGGLVFNQHVLRNVSLDEGGRLDGIAYYDANDLSMLMVVTIPLLLLFLVRGRPGMRALAILCLVVSVLVFLKAGSRGGFLGMVAVSLYLLFQFHGIRKAVRFGAVAIVAVLMLLFAGEQFWGTMGTILNPQDDYNMSGENGRKAIWLRGLGYMMQRPITGVGFQAFPTADGTLSEHAVRQMYGFGVKWSAAHNSFLQIGAELGVGGIIAFLALLWFAFSTARRLGRRREPDGTVPDEAVLAQGLAGTMIAYAVCGFFLSQAYSCMMLMLLAMIVALEKVFRLQDDAQASSRESVRTGRRTAFGAAAIPAGKLSG